MLEIRNVEMLVPQLWLFNRKPHSESEYLCKISIYLDVGLGPSTTPIPRPPGSILSIPRSLLSRAASSGMLEQF